MDPTITGIATSFSRHRFDEAYPLMFDDIEWTLVGGTDAHGKDAVSGVRRPRLLADPLPVTSR
jgi:hypothetical protein